MPVTSPDNWGRRIFEVLKLKPTAAMEARWKDLLYEISKIQNEVACSVNVKPIPMRLPCPGTVERYGHVEPCGILHVDEGEFADKLHTHACQSCGHVWRPAIVPTVGVRFLPGYKSE